MSEQLDLVDEQKKETKAAAIAAIAAAFVILNKSANLPFDEWTKFNRPLLNEIALRYSLSGSIIAAKFYDKIRDTANLSVSFTAKSKIIPEAIENFANQLGYSFTMMQQGKPYKEVKSLIAGQLMEAVFTASRKTSEYNGKKDSVRTRYMLVASPGACPWCLTRSAVQYLDELDVPADGYHINCKCVVVPVYGNSFPDSVFAQQYISDFAPFYADNKHLSVKDLSKKAHKELNW